VVAQRAPGRSERTLEFLIGRQIPEGREVVDVVADALNRSGSVELIEPALRTGITGTIQGAAGISALRFSIESRSASR
jgi:hypothetical protein